VAGFFDSKPSEAHVVWQSGPDDGTTKFDFEYLELWAAHFGVEYKEWDRVDHERGDESRKQHVCVFARTKTGGNEVSLDGETWTMGATEKPRTFIEIDTEGMLRLQGWTTERIVDLDELVIDGTTLKLRTATGDTKSLDTSRLASRPE
jgi:hypothetical protein